MSKVRIRLPWPRRAVRLAGADAVAFPMFAAGVLLFLLLVVGAL